MGSVIVTLPCPSCKKDLSLPVYGLEEPVAPSVLDEAREWLRWQHWCNVHRLCAVCGKYVRSGESGDLECAVNDGKIAIHPNYNDYFRSVDRGDIGRLLYVHKSCVEGRPQS